MTAIELDRVEERTEEKTRKRVPVDRTRRGVITVDCSILERDKAAMQLLMSRIIVTRAEMLYHRDAFQYVALSDRFEPVPPGCVTPEYDAIFTELKTGKLSLVFRKVSP